MDTAERPDRYAVIGHPVAHSKSPDIHARFAALTGQSLVYERVLAPLDGLAATVRDFAAAGGRGCNVTVPFKFEAHDLAQRCSPRAMLAQAVNTLRFDADGWFGDNTDGAGLVHDLQHNAGIDLAGRDLLLLGAGGAAAGVLGPLLAARPRRVVVANRSPDKARALVQRHAPWAQAHEVELWACGLDDCGSGYGLVLNATAASLQGAGSPVSAAVLGPGAVAVDLMYGPAAQAFLQWAREHGATARDGLGMLVEQAAEAFQVWRGVRPPTAEVLRELRTGLTA
ncbi:shikimate dehydrogenase [Caldimonas sp.]|uniref:shikimate dehydrogenase n=1 Tax=Caldimonas sp. TaxID=2838790 RepID=UPI0029DD6E56|nr:shikimate dehydrogenase [Caldimonas manganoxidans]